MAYRKVDESNLSSLADKIRAKGGTSGGMVFPAGFLSAVDALPDKPAIEPLEVTENGTYAAPSGVDGYSPVTVNVAASGGFELPEPKLLCTLTAEMNLKEILTANPIPRKYKRSLVFFLHSGENIASQGGVYRNIVFYCTPVNGNAGPNFMVQHYNNSAVAPDSMIPGCNGGSNGAYFSIRDDGSLTALGMTNTTRYFAVGNTIHYIEIPFNYETLTMDTTEWGAS